MVSKISNSEIGSIHWLNTLLGRQIHIGEILQQTMINHNLIDYDMFGEQLNDISQELLNHYSPITPVNPISEEERIKFLKLALSLQGIIINTQIADEVLQTVDKIAELGGEFNLYDSAKISAAIRNKYKEEPKK